jgi:hypothetical protein
MSPKQPAFRLRALVVLVALTGLAAVSCGNATDDTSGGNAAPKATTSGTGVTTGTANTDTQTKVSLTGVPGVTDSEIDYSVIGTKANNPLGTCVLDCYVDGVQAYFDYRNSTGGIYGRKLVLSKKLDDELAQNQVRALEVVTANDTFGNFNATEVGNGWGTLGDAGIPTYVWMIHPAEMAGHPSIWGSREPACISCTSRTVAYVVKQAGAKHVASLGYGISDDSKLCAQSQAASIQKYSNNIGGAEVAYTNDGLAFGLPNGIGPEVTAMKQAGVDLIMGCLDLNGMKTLAQELKRQGMGDVPMYHTNTYDQGFVAAAGDLFEGDYMLAQFRPFEAEAGSSNLAAYKEWMAKDGKTLTELAMVGWINADQAYQGLKAAGPNFDRQKVIDATNAMTAYTAGGLVQPMDYTRQHEIPTEDDPKTHGPAQDCIALVKVKDAKFVMVGDPAKPWACWPGANRDWSEPVATNFG